MEIVLCLNCKSPFLCILYLQHLILTKKFFESAFLCYLYWPFLSIIRTVEWHLESLSRCSPVTYKIQCCKPLKLQLSSPHPKKKKNSILLYVIFLDLKTPIWPMNSTISDNYIHTFLIVLIISHELKKFDDNYTLDDTRHDKLAIFDMRHSTSD